MGSLSASTAAELLESIRANQVVGDEGVPDVYDELPGVEIDFMLGTWRGGVFHYDHPFGKRLLAINWYGKRFRGPDDVEPLLVHGSGGEIESYEAFGLARLREVRFRGKVSMAMLYDKQPLIDHFRRLSDDVVIGLADEKNKPSTYYFYLARV
ncbi:DUF4334 domain-containing protein [Mycobacterium intracellulare]|uniref:DUF4334 domain-containing protein n=1 Tax=Mycobacterium intracellulare TaxID=1767 RepID=UPI0034D4A9D4